MLWSVHQTLFSRPNDKRKKGSGYARLDNCHIKHITMTTQNKIQLLTQVREDATMIHSTTPRITTIDVLLFIGPHQH